LRIELVRLNQDHKVDWTARAGEVNAAPGKQLSASVAAAWGQLMFG